MFAHIYFKDENVGVEATKWEVPLSDYTRVSIAEAPMFPLVDFKKDSNDTHDALDRMYRSIKDIKLNGKRTMQCGDLFGFNKHFYELCEHGFIAIDVINN